MQEIISNAHSCVNFGVADWLCMHSAQVHGFPRVMGVLTHLDGLRISRTQSQP
jgi:hypothetical protein